MTCHQPRITEKVKNIPKWLCINCQMPEQLAISDIQLSFGRVDTTHKLNGTITVSRKSQEIIWH